MGAALVQKVDEGSRKDSLETTLLNYTWWITATPRTREGPTGEQMLPECAEGNRFHID